MDIYESAFVNLWDCLNRNKVRYIMVGGFATYLHGCHKFTRNIDLYLEDTPENRRKLRESLKDLGLGDFEPIERIEFIPGRFSIRQWFSNNYNNFPKRGDADL